MSENDEWLHEAVRGIYRRLERIEDGQNKRLEHVENRVSSLELWRSFLAGAWTILAAGVGLVFQGRSTH